MTAELSAARYRAGSGEPLVLLHGFTATWRCWLPVIAPLVARFEVIAPTLHGHDGGPALPEGSEAHTIAEAARHVESQLDELGIETAHFAGNSMGGALSLELAKRGRARSVVAISPGGGWAADDTREADRIIAFFTRTQRITRASDRYLERIMARPALRRIAMRDVMARGHLVPATEAIALARGSIGCTVVDEVLDTIRAGNATMSGLGEIDVPVLVTWGEQDRILPLERHAARFREEIPGVEFRAHPGIGHTPMWDDPTLIAQAIGDFAAANS